MAENNWTEAEATQAHAEVLRLRRELRETQEALSRASSALQRVDESQSLTLDRLQKVDKTADRTLRTLERRKKNDEEHEFWTRLCLLDLVFVYFLDWLSPGSTWIKAVCVFANVYFVVRIFMLAGRMLREEFSKQQERE